MSITTQSEENELPPEIQEVAISPEVQAFRQTLVEGLSNYYLHYLKSRGMFPHPLGIKGFVAELIDKSRKKALNLSIGSASLLYLIEICQFTSEDTLDMALINTPFQVNET